MISSISIHHAAHLCFCFRRGCKCIYFYIIVFQLRSVKSFIGNVHQYDLAILHCFHSSRFIVGFALRVCWKSIFCVSGFSIFESRLLFCGFSRFKTILCVCSKICWIVSLWWFVIVVWNLIRIIYSLIRNLNRHFTRSKIFCHYSNWWTGHRYSCTHNDRSNFS